MKYLFFLICVAVGQGFVAENTRVVRVSELDIPSFQKTQLYDPANVNLTWTEVKSDNPQDPVLGYKLRVWERPISYKFVMVNGFKLLDEESVPTELRDWERPITYKYIMGNGVKILVEDTEPSEPKNNTIPTSKLTEYITNKNTYSLGGLKINMWYGFSVLTFTKTRESKGSAPVSVRIYPRRQSSNDRDFYEIV